MCMCIVGRSGFGAVCELLWECVCVAGRSVVLVPSKEQNGTRELLGGECVCVCGGEVCSFGAQ